jgi:hypothetical protein
MARGAQNVIEKPILIKKCKEWDLESLLLKLLDLKISLNYIIIFILVVIIVIDKVYPYIKDKRETVTSHRKALSLVLRFYCSYIDYICLFNKKRPLKELSDSDYYDIMSIYDNFDKEIDYFSKQLNVSFDDAPVIYWKMHLLMSHFANYKTTDLILDEIYKDNSEEIFKSIIIRNESYRDRNEILFKDLIIDLLKKSKINKSESALINSFSINDTIKINNEFIEKVIKKNS